MNYRRRFEQTGLLQLIVSQSNQRASAPAVNLERIAQPMITTSAANDSRAAFIAYRTGWPIATPLKGGNAEPVASTASHFHCRLRRGCQPVLSTAS